MEEGGSGAAPATDAPGTSASPGSASASAAQARTSGEVPQPLQKVHLLPFVESEAKLEGQTRLDAIAPALRAKRSTKEVVQAGDIVSHDDLRFVVIKCNPNEGCLDVDTDYYLDGSPLVCFEKIQFSAWGPNKLTSDEVFSQCIVPTFSGEYSPFGSAKTKRAHLLYMGKVIEVNGMYLQVEATEPGGLGIVSTSTEIFTNWDETPEFEKVHIVPFQDTLPRAYEFDVFHDYLKPYLKTNLNKKFQSNELFMYHGVQFKMVACEPNNVPARIGKSTTIYCEGTLHPSLRNLLPPDLLSQVAQLPPGLQMLLLNTERTTRELEDMLTQRRGLFEETIGEIESFKWPPEAGVRTSQTSCMVCLNDFEIGDDCRRLPCNHVFHSSCIVEWLRRCTDCPICKDNVDRAIRHY